MIKEITISNTCLVRIPNRNAGSSYQFTFDSSNEIGEINFSEILMEMARAHAKHIEVKDE